MARKLHRIRFMRPPRHRSRRRASAKRLLGTPMFGVDGARLGDVVDLQVRLRSGRVTRVVVRLDDEGGQKLVSIPWNMVSLANDGLVTVASRDYLLGRTPSPDGGGVTVERSPFARPTL